MYQNPNFPPITSEEKRIDQEQKPPSRLKRAVSAVGEMAASKAIKTGAKKAVSWLATKFAATKAGTALAPGIGTVIGLVVDTAISVVKKIFQKVKLAIFKAVKEPDKALWVVAAGIALIFFLPMPLALIGTIPIILGSLSLLGAIAGGIAAGVVGFFGALVMLPIGPIVGIVIAVVFIGIIAISFFIVITTAGAFILPIVPSEIRYVSPFPPSVIEAECPDLIDLINEIAGDHCVPPALLMAISRMEASGVWGWSCEEIVRFSEPNWWEGASEAELNRGYCYDTCARSGLCSGTTVMGPMQFEERTWQGIMPEPEYSSMDRCRLDLSMIAAAKKIKANSGTGPGECGPWDEDTVRLVAYRYCGSCGTYGCQNSPDPNNCSPACGFDYCTNVWDLYQQYESQ